MRPTFPHDFDVLPLDRRDARVFRRDFRSVRAEDEYVADLDLRSVLHLRLVARFLREYVFLHGVVLNVDDLPARIRVENALAVRELDDPPFARRDFDLSGNLRDDGLALRSALKRALQRAGDPS